MRQPSSRATLFVLLSLARVIIALHPGPPSTLLKVFKLLLNTTAVARFLRGSSEYALDNIWQGCKLWLVFAGEAEREEQTGDETPRHH